MKKIIIGFALSLITLSVSAQSPNKGYELFIVSVTDKIGGPRAIPIGGFLRNDTLFLEPGAIVNVVAIHSEDSTWKHILLKPFREKPINSKTPIKKN